MQPVLQSQLSVHLLVWPVRLVSLLLLLVRLLMLPVQLALLLLLLVRLLVQPVRLVSLLLLLVHLLVRPVQLASRSRSSVRLPEHQRMDGFPVDAVFSLPGLSFCFYRHHLHSVHDIRG